MYLFSQNLLPDSTINVSCEHITESTKMKEKNIRYKLDGEWREAPAGTSFAELVKEPAGDLPTLLVQADGHLRELHMRAVSDCVLERITITDPIGSMTYRRSACMLLYKALHDLTSGCKDMNALLRFNVPDGIYFTIPGFDGVNEEFLASVKERMRVLSESCIPFMKKNVSLSEAMEIFRRQGMEDKIRLMRFRRVSRVNLYFLEDYADYFYGYMVAHTGFVNAFDLRRHEDGFILVLPPEGSAALSETPIRSEKLFAVRSAFEKWGDALGFRTVGELNESICRNGYSNMLLMQEAMQEGQLARIASRIAARRQIRIILIAGPSSSGKTSFSHRLSIQLSAMGYTPHPIAMDDYFIDRANTPLDENGEKDFECLEALDVELFNQDMLSLLDGKEVRLPSYNFLTGKREYHSGKLRLGEKDILVIEGIHGLNPALSYALPQESLFRIYVSAMTQLNIDEHNPIPETDVRLIRRIIRDARTRGYSASQTIQRWPAVRRGEERNIFPFQEQADVMFNTAMVYETGVLKVYAEPLLFDILPGDPAYLEAHRLLKLFDYFLPLPGDEVPRNSLLREFIGGSCFPVS